MSYVKGLTKKNVCNNETALSAVYFKVFGIKRHYFFKYFIEYVNVNT